MSAPTARTPTENLSCAFSPTMREVFPRLPIRRTNTIVRSHVGRLFSFGTPVASKRPVNTTVKAESISNGLKDQRVNILLAIDSSAGSEAAVEEIASRLWPPLSHVCAVTVVKPPIILDSTESASLIRTTNENAETLVRSAAVMLSQRGITSNWSVLRGHPTDGITDYANLLGADFVVVGSHRRPGLLRFLMGSVAQAVLRRAACSVLIVRTKPDSHSFEKDLSRILLATDGSSFSEAAARSIAARPWPTNADVRVVSAVTSAVAGMEPWLDRTEVMERLQEDALRRANEAVRESSRILTESGLKTSGKVLIGHPTDAILEEALRSKTDLIVLGSHSRQHVRRLLLGSVAEAVAANAPCCVEVIRERPQ